MLEVLIYMFNHYIDKQAFLIADDFAEHDLTKELTEAGFEHHEIMNAIDWFKDLHDLSSQSHQQHHSTSQAIRIYTDKEQEHIDMESLGFISFLEQAKIITASERDLIVDRAMAIQQANITIEEIRWITMMVLWDDKRKKDYLFVEDAVFNPQGRTLQ